MTAATDFIRLPYASDLTEGGISYALRELRYQTASLNQFRRRVAHAAAEIAFRRHLSAQGIPFEVKRALPLEEHERYDALLNGRRCDLKTFWISSANQIAALRRDPRILLEAPALVPSDVDAGEGHRDDDLYLFAFVVGTKAVLAKETEEARRAGQPLRLLHQMPRAWNQPARWTPLGGLILKSEAEEGIQIEMHGQDATGGFLSRGVHLLPRARTALPEGFYALSAITARQPAQGRIGLRSAARDGLHIIAPKDWENIWVYGIEIILAGFLTRGEFHRRARALPPGSRVFQFNRTRIKNLYVPISALKPAQNLSIDRTSPLG